MTLASPPLAPDRSQKGNPLPRERLSAFCASVPSIHLFQTPTGVFVADCEIDYFTSMAPTLALFLHDAPLVLSAYQRIRVWVGLDSRRRHSVCIADRRHAESMDCPARESSTATDNRRRYRVLLDAFAVPSHAHDCVCGRPSRQLRCAQRRSRWRHTQKNGKWRRQRRALVIT